jgi:hypothetical protein
MNSSTPDPNSDATPNALPPSAPQPTNPSALAPDAQSAPAAVPEIGGRKDGSEPTRYGDWEKGGRCIDF